MKAKKKTILPKDHSAVNIKFKKPIQVKKNPNYLKVFEMIHLRKDNYQCTTCGGELFKKPLNGKCYRCDREGYFRHLTSDEYYCAKCGRLLSVDEIKRASCDNCKREFERCLKSLNRVKEE